MQSEELEARSEINNEDIYFFSSLTKNVCTELTLLAVPDESNLT